MAWSWSISSLAWEFSSTKLYRKFLIYRTKNWKCDLQLFFPRRVFSVVAVIRSKKICFNYKLKQFKWEIRRPGTMCALVSFKSTISVCSNNNFLSATYFITIPFFSMCVFVCVRRTSVHWVWYDVRWTAMQIHRAKLSETDNAAWVCVGYGMGRD